MKRTGPVREGQEQEQAVATLFKSSQQPATSAWRLSEAGGEQGWLPTTLGQRTPGPVVGIQLSNLF